jgi:A/G-specific adenine glycosylase
MLNPKLLNSWFNQSKRELPWRENPSPYAVWVSEVMLQQTQVAVVVPYFLRWMDRFPTVQALADASLDEVIKMWEGLGYYSRARNLHQGAKMVVEHFQGKIPDNAKDLISIKGIGDYTVGAILSFAFHQRISAVDGNVIRVLTRFLRIEEDIAKPRVVKQLRETLQKMLPEEESWVFNEALIELGATICQKKPKCGSCPLNLTCESFSANVAEQLPYKSSKTQIEALYRIVALLECSGHFLVRRVAKGEIMSDLHEFPYFDAPPLGIDEKAVQQKMQKEFGLQTSVKAALPNVSHSFTRFRVKLYPYHLVAKSFKAIPGYQWIEFEEMQKLAFSSGHRKVLNQCLMNEKK